MTTNPGFYKTLPAADYHAADAINNSGFTQLARSPFHFRHAEPREATRSMHLGSALHMAVLEPEKFEDSYLILDVDDRRSSIYKEAAKTRDPETILTRTEADKIHGMQSAASGNVAIATALASCKSFELSMFVNDPQTGELCKCRYDAIGQECIVDVKTTADASPEAFSKAIFNYRYHVQAAFYLDAYEWKTGQKIPAFYFAAIENESPHACQLYRLDDFSIELGRREYRRLLDLYHQCKTTDTWPAYSAGMEPELIAVPEWALRDLDEE